MIFSVKDIVSCTEPTFNWINIYGAPLGHSGENTDKMNHHPEMASKWKGRILVQYYAEDTKNPELKKQQISPENKALATKWVNL